jgi:hypothetical protein
VDAALQGLTPGAQLQLLFAGVGSVVFGPVTADLSGNGGATFTLPPGQYSGSFQLVGLGIAQMVTEQATFTIGPETTSTTATTPSSWREPPGLVNGWATSNVTVMSTTFTQTIILNGLVTVSLSSISVASSTNGQIMANIASNPNVVQVEFDHDGGTKLILHSSSRPAAVYADDQLLAEASSSASLTVNSNAWVYEQSSGTLTVFADPSTITAFYGSATPIPEFPNSLLALGIPLLAFASIFLATTRKRKQSSR